VDDKIRTAAKKSSLGGFAFLWGGFLFVRGGWYRKFDKLSTDSQRFIFQFGGVGRFLWG